MSEQAREAFEQEVERLQELLVELQALDNPAAQAAAQELVQAVIGLHGQGLADLLGIIHEAGVQPADTLMPKFAANSAVRGLMLLHDLHPDDLATRAHQAVERLRPHLAVQGARADVISVENQVVHVQVVATGQKQSRPAAQALKREIEDALLEAIPDATEIIFEGLETTGAATESYVSFNDIKKSAVAAAGK